MAKVKLKIKHVVDNIEENYIVYAIKTDNKYFYTYDNSKFTIQKENQKISIKLANDITHEIFFEQNSSYGIIDKKFSYEIKLINLKILDKIIEIDYKIDNVNKFVLEEVND